jgi:dUTP pyrophosphatase
MYSNSQKGLIEAINNGTLTEFINEMNTTINTESYKIPLKFVNKSNNPDPEYAKTGDSGFDIRANIGEDIILNSLGRILVPTGLFFELPMNMEIQIRSRSGNSFRYGIFVLNSPGTLDELYRGELSVILMNLGNEPFTIKHGDRIAQGVLASVSGQRMVSLTKVNEIDTNTDRSTDGFGSTGLK